MLDADQACALLGAEVHEVVRLAARGTVRAVPASWRLRFRREELETSARWVGRGRAWDHSVMGVKAAARYLGLARNAVYRLIRSGELYATDRPLCLSRQHLDAFIERCRMNFPGTSQAAIRTRT